MQTQKHLYTRTQRTHTRRGRTMCTWNLQILIMKQLKWTSWIGWCVNCQTDLLRLCIESTSFSDQFFFSSFSLMNDHLFSNHIIVVKRRTISVIFYFLWCFIRISLRIDFARMKLKYFYTEKLSWHSNIFNDQFQFWFVAQNWLGLILLSAQQYVDPAQVI